jgi:hypothetical protein
MIKPILYERIEQKNEIERELFSKLSDDEILFVEKSWTRLLTLIKRSQKSIKKK